MGGQACILYGAAEFSRDTDFAIQPAEENLARIREALRELDAEQVFVPPLEIEFLARGHACHFRCRAAGANGIRIDMLARMRGCDPFAALWERRASIDLPELSGVLLLGLPDLVAAKKTQRDKDWPMIRRLVEADYERNRATPPRDKILFWLREGRSAAILCRLAREHPSLAAEVRSSRPLVSFAESGDEDRLERALLEEQERERALDREYWKPLRRELESLRRQR